MASVISNEETCHEGEATMEHKREGTNEKQTKNVIETDLSSACERTMMQVLSSYMSVTT